jgi:signal peptidase I
LSAPPRPLVDDLERSVRPPDLLPAQRAALRGPQRRPGKDGGLGELPVLIAVALLLAFLIKTFLVQAFYIPSGSMLDTLQLNDRVLVEKVSFRFRDPDRGEIIVFRRPGAEVAGGPTAVVRSFLEGVGLLAPDEEIDLIKRVVGLPGEIIEIVDGEVRIDGVPLEEPYTLPDGRSFAAVRVPEGHYYLLGDNRSNSDDSRYGLGMVPREAVVGRAFLILWPPGNATFRLGHPHPDLAGTAAPEAEPPAAQPPGPPAVQPPEADPSAVPEAGEPVPAP